MKSRLTPVLSSLLLVGCYSGKDNAPKPITVRMENFTVAPGEEVTKCQVVKLENAAAYDFSGVSSTMATGSHHLILYTDGSYLVPGAVPLEEGFGDCEMGAPRLYVYGAQEPVHSVTMPAGIAGQLPAGTTVILEAHYANASDAPIQADVEVTLEPATGPIDHYSGVVFAIDTDFLIPAQAGQNGAPMYSHSTTCLLPEAVNVFRLGSHTHKRLDKTEIFQHDGVAPTTKLYENTDWHSPAELQFPDGAPLPVAANQGFTFTCSWYNETDTAIDFGESVDDEMCIMGAGFYPRLDGPMGLDGVIFCLNGQIYY